LHDERRGAFEKCFLAFYACFGFAALPHELVLEGDGGTCASDRWHYFVYRQFFHHMTQLVAIGAEDGTCPFMPGFFPFFDVLGDSSVVHAL